MTDERRRDTAYKAMFLIVCSLTGGGTGFLGIQIAQAKMETRLSAVETGQAKLTADFKSLATTVVTREENRTADGAQDQRMADIFTSIENIRKDQQETLRLLAQLQRRSRSE